MKTLFFLFALLFTPLTFAQTGSNGSTDEEGNELKVAIEVDVKILTCYTGSYELHTDTFKMVVDILLKDGKLIYKEYRGDRIFESELQALSHNEFFFKENDAIVQFEKTENCVSPSFDISIGGSTYTCIRKG